MCNVKGFFNVYVYITIIHMEEYRWSGGKCVTQQQMIMASFFCALSTRLNAGDDDDPYGSTKKKRVNH